jgi:hypothetical protein
MARCGWLCFRRQDDLPPHSIDPGTKSRPRRFSFAKVFLMLSAAAALALAPLPSWAQRGGGGGGGGGHVGAGGGGGHFGGGGGSGHAVGAGTHSSSGSGHSSGFFGHIFSFHGSKPAHTQSSAGNSKSSASRPGEVSKFWSEYTRGFSTGSAAARPLGTNSVAGANSASRYPAIPSHVTIGFPPRSPVESASLSALPPGHSSPVTFYGEGNEFWKEPVSPSHLQQQRAPAAAPAPVFHPAPFHPTVIPPQPKPGAISHPLMTPPRRMIISSGGIHHYGPVYEAPVPRPRFPVFPVFPVFPGFGGVGFFGFGFPFGLNGGYLDGFGCDPFWIFPCNADFYSGYDSYASQVSNPVDLNLGLQAPEEEEVYPSLWASPPYGQGSSPEEIEAEKILTVLYLKDGSVYAVTDYWVADGKLHYNASYGGQNSIDIDLLDLQRTVNANAARGVPFTLNPAPSSAPTPQSPQQPQSPSQLAQPQSTAPQSPPQPAATPHT